MTLGGALRYIAEPIIVIILEVRVLARAFRGYEQSLGIEVAMLDLNNLINVHHNRTFLSAWSAHHAIIVFASERTRHSSRRRQVP